MCIKHVIVLASHSVQNRQQMNTNEKGAIDVNQPNSTRVIYYYISPFPYIYLLDDYIHQ